jgi:hypothetical protein
MPLFREPNEEELIRNRAIPEFTVMDAASAAWERGKKERETSALSRMYFQGQAGESGPKLSAEELNNHEFLKDSGVTFDREMSLAEAMFVAEEHEEIRKLDQRLARAKGFFESSVVPFVAGAASAMADPIGVASGLIGAKMATLGIRTLTKGGASKALTYGANLASDLLTNTASESLVMAQTRNEQREYTTSQMLQNVVGGTLVLNGATRAGGVLLDKLKNLKVKNIDKSISRKLFGAAENALEAGVSPDEMLRSADSIIGKKLEIDTPIRDAVTESLDAKFLDGVENVPTLFDKIRKGVQEGDISEIQIRDLSERMRAYGVDETKFELKDGNIELRNGEADILKKQIDNPEADLKRDVEAENFLERESKINVSEEERLIQENFERLKQDEDILSEADIRDLESSMEEIEFQRTYTDCIKQLGASIATE